MRMFWRFVSVVSVGLAVTACGDAPSSEAEEPSPAPVTTSEPAADDAPASDQDLTALAPKGRLSGKAMPRAYDLDMRIDPRETHFSGTVTITIELAEAADGIWLHGDGITVNEAQISAEGSQWDVSYAQVLPTGVSRVDFGETVRPGTIDLTLVYEAPFDTNLAGLFRVEEQGEAYALAKSESIQARKFLPGFDEPGFKAPVDLTLTIPEGYVAITNTPETSREAAEEAGYERVRFKTTRPMSTYLLSLSVGPFDVVERPPLPVNSVRDFEVPLRGIARKGRGADLAYVLDITPGFMDIFEEAIGLPYPYEKLDIVAAPQWPSGATELSAAITYREQRILVGDDPAPGTRRSLLSIHAHEIAHMWFGNLVTPPWWDDLWLKEGFATWGTPMALEQWEPEGGHDIDAVDRALVTMTTDSLSTVRRVRETIDVNEDIRNAYTAIPYSKGMAIIRMVETYFGIDAFRKALGQYILAYEDGAAHSDQFFETIGAVTGDPALTRTFASFVDQPGVPLVETRLDCTGETPRVAFSQSRYKPVGSRIGQQGGQDAVWSIPICVAYGTEEGDAQRACTLLEEREGALDLEAAACPRWVMPNAQGTGYYRWALDAEGWQALAGRFDAMPATEALSVVDSAAAAFESGASGADALLSVYDQAAASPVRQVALKPLFRLDAYIGRVEDQETRAALRAYGQRLYGARYEALLEEGGEDATLMRTRLATFLALTVRDPALREKLADKAARFVGLEGEPDTTALTSDEYGTALSVAVQDLGAPFIDRLIEARSEIDDPRFEGASATALGRVRDAEQAERVRRLILSGDLGSREAYSILAGQMAGRETREATWVWMQESIAEIVERIPGQWRRRLPTLAAGFCDADRVGEVEGFFAQNASLMPGYARQMRQVAERIELCDAFQNDLSADLLRALSAEGQRAE